MKPQAGWFPGLMDDIAALHARQYAASHGFGVVFEGKVARQLGQFLARSARAGDFFRGDVVEGRALGSTALDDEGSGLAGSSWMPACAAAAWVGEC